MNGIQNLCQETIAEFMEKGLSAEREDKHGCSKSDDKNKDTDNGRNGHSRKLLRASFDNMEDVIPRNRNGKFKPQFLKKKQTSINQNIEEKSLSLYAKGMTTSNIASHVRNISGIEVSGATNIIEGGQPAALQGNQSKICFSNGRQSAEKDASGNDGHYEKANRAGLGREHNLSSAGCLLCRQNARLSRYALTHSTPATNRATRKWPP